MRKALFMVALAATLTACASHPNQNQQQLAARLKASPSKTILLTYAGDAGVNPNGDYGARMAKVNFEMVCGIQQNEVELARIGSWACPSYDSKLDGLGTDTPINIVTKHFVLKVVQPGDADYNQYLQKIVAVEVLHQPPTNA